MSDLFNKHEIELISPADDGFSITPNSNNYFTQPTRQIWVGGAGNIEMEMVSSLNDANTTLTLYNVPQGTLLNVRARRVLDNTDATLLTGLF